jgi:hypothetical protein
MNSNQVVCSFQCSVEYSIKSRKKKEKKEEREWRKRKSEIKENLRTKSYYIKILQTLVNKFVRMRDDGSQCISCNLILDSKKIKFDAGHYFNVGQYPQSELRFNLDNIHAQCTRCNRELSGNLIEYREKLIQKIGEERFKQLEEQKNTTSQISKYEVKELISHFKKKINEFNDLERDS